jgi:uncharacterized protein
MRKFSTTLFLFFTLSAAVGTFAQTAQDPWAAWKAKDFETALTGFKVLAEKGDVKAQERLGWMFKAGEGTPKDDVQALAWFRKAADQGNIPSQTELGRISSVPTFFRGARADWARNPVLNLLREA